MGFVRRAQCQCARSSTEAERCCTDQYEERQRSCRNRRRSGGFTYKVLIAGSPRRTGVNYCKALTCSAMSQLAHIRQTFDVRISTATSGRAVYSRISKYTDQICIPRRLTAEMIGTDKTRNVSTDTVRALSSVRRVEIAALILLQFVYAWSLRSRLHCWA